MTANLPLNALRAFEAVARLGSFTAAADALFVTQSAVSHQVRHLEDWLGTPLFAREGKGMRPLPAATDLARTLSLSLSEIAAACDRIRADKGPRPLTIAAIPSVAVCWLIPRLAEFRAAHPGTDIRIIYALHGRDIDFRDAHLAFVFAKGTPTQGAPAAPFLPGTSAPVCSPALAERLAIRAGTRPAPTDWALLHDSDRSGWQAWFARAGLSATPQPGPVFEDFNLLRAAALSGQGVALCPLAMIGPDLAAGHLVQLSTQTVMEDHGYWLLSAPQTDPALQRAASAFADWALAQAVTDAGSDRHPPAASAR